jgi:acetyl esterase/lipase
MSQGARLMRRSTWLLLVVVSLAVSACGGAVQVREGLTGPGTELIDVYFPRADSPLPVVVMLHGESRAGEGRSALRLLAEATAELGAVVFVPEWRSVAGPAERDEFRNDPVGYLADQAEDVVCALRFARSHGARFGGDPETLTLVAFSQGGAIGAAVALWDGTSTDDPGCLPTVDHRPDVFVGLGGDYRWTDIVGLLPPSVWAPHDPFALLGASQSLRVRLVHGSEDRNASSVESGLLHTALQGAGYDATLTLVEARHAEIIDPDHPAGREATRQILGYRASIPTVEVRFDGAACTYRGPNDLEPGLVDVVFVNTHSTNAALAFTPLRGDTWDEFLANTATSRPNYASPSGTEPTFLRIVPAGEHLTTTLVPTTTGNWAMSCTTGPDFTTGLVPAAHVRVVEQ